MGLTKSNAAGWFLLLAAGAWGLAPSRAAADMLTVTDYADAYAEAPNSGGPYNVLVGNGNDLVIRQFAASTSDVALAKFDLSALPTNATITGVQFQFDSVVITGNTGRVVDVLGFTTSGGVTLADATVAASALGSYDNFALGLGVHTINLSLATFQALLNSSHVLGLRLQGDVESVNTAITSLRSGALGPPPQLTITFTAVPEPAAVVQVLVGLALLAGGGWRRWRTVRPGP